MAEVVREHPWRICPRPTVYGAAARVDEATAAEHGAGSIAIGSRAGYRGRTLVIADTAPGGDLWTGTRRSGIHPARRAQLERKVGQPNPRGRSCGPCGGSSALRSQRSISRRRRGALHVARDCGIQRAAAEPAGNGHRASGTRGAIRKQRPRGRFRIRRELGMPLTYPSYRAGGPAALSGETVGQQL